MKTPLLSAMSRSVGWLADRRVPRRLRPFVYKTYARVTGAELDDVLLSLDSYPSLGAFFVRTLKAGVRPIESDPDRMPSPCDSTVQDLSVVSEGSLLQAKGQSYPLRELLAGVGEDLDLEGAATWTLYLSPRDYHRVHSPVDGTLSEVRWVPGSFYSVAPKVLLRRPRVFARNERAVLRLETERGPLLLVMVGALNVARIRVVGVEPGTDGTPTDGPRSFARGEELARFEMGSTVVLIAPRGGPQQLEGLAEGQALRLGQAIGRWA